MNARLATAAKVALLVAVSPLVAVPLAACSFSASASTVKSVPGDELAGTVQKQLVTSNPGITVTGTRCADTPKIAKDLTTECTATVNGEATKLVVTWTNATGDYTVESVAA
jgi:hypothetical protein